MKKIALAMSFLAAVCSAKAQIDDDLGKNALKLNPLSILVATGNISYERVTTEKQSFQLGAFYTGVKLSGTKYRGFGITPEYRFFVGRDKQAMNGMYVAPFLRYQHFTLEVPDESTTKVDYSSIGGGAVLGWETTMDDIFVVDFFFGPAYNSSTTNGYGYGVNSNFKGLTARVGLNFGFRF